MQASSMTASGSTTAAPPTDIATKIAVAMRAMGVMGMPRNYEIFYEVFTGSNHDLNAELGALGNRPRQEDLDRLSVKYFIQNSNHLFVENVRDQIANKVEEVMILFEKERIQLERYGSILNQTSDGLTKRNMVTQEILQRIAGIMTAATDSKIEQGRTFVASMVDKSAELEEVKGKLEEYKRLADTDAMTQLQNRRAFDKALARLYDDHKRVMFGALVIVDIDRFKQINDRFGHPFGDKIIRHIASVIRAAAGADTLVARTGGEEFALVVEGLNEEAVADLAERVRTAVERLTAPMSGAGCGPITISLGICMAAHAAGADDLYAKADRALYVSKSNGRNQATRFSSLRDGAPSKGWLLYRRD